MQRLFDVKKTQLQMTNDRGYAIPPQEAAIMTMDLRGFQTYLGTTKIPGKRERQLLSGVYSKIGADGRETRLVVSFAAKDESTTMVSTAIVSAFANSVKQQENAGVAVESIFIVDSKLTNEASKLIIFKCQVFLESDLTYNPTKHVDTPKHELLTPEEKAKVLSDLRVDITKLLLIRADDPIVLYYGWSVGDVIRIRRNDRQVSVLAPESINYRVVVDI
jgi:DNA-directed RNA polymerases I, II, and III subunit RPABC1